MTDAATAQRYLDQLTVALQARGLKAVAKMSALSVRNAAVTGQDPRGEAMTPGLSQGILIRNYEGRGLTWCWIWPALRPAERGVPTPPPEVEPICPAPDIQFAADRIANVVRLHSEEPGDA
jgi:hypothetical protein